MTGYIQKPEHQLIASAMTPGIMIMYLAHVAMTYEKIQLAHIIKALRNKNPQANSQIITKMIGDLVVTTEGSEPRRHQYFLLSKPLSRYKRAIAKS